jgi:hypothetical protein
MIVAFIVPLLMPTGNLQASKKPRVIHVFVALCDNASQSIVPVPAKIGNGDDPANNLYWGCDEGLKSYFKRSRDWKLLESPDPLKPEILERAVFQHSTENAILIADAYRGSKIKTAIEDFFGASAGSISESVRFGETEFQIAGDSDLVAFIGHNGFMDFTIGQIPQRVTEGPADAIVLCCLSDKYFSEAVKSTGARPLLLTTQLMYPGSFILKHALDGWLLNEAPEEIRERAAKSYSDNQKISLKVARGVFVAAP